VHLVRSGVFATRRLRGLVLLRQFFKLPFMLSIYQLLSSKGELLVVLLARSLSVAIDNTRNVKLFSSQVMA